MDTDCVDITDNKGGDFITIFTDIIARIPYKMAFLLFLIFMLIISDLFQEYWLIQFKGAVEDDHVTSYGHIIQGLSLALLYIIFDALIFYGII